MIDKGASLSAIAITGIYHQRPGIVPYGMEMHPRNSYLQRKNDTCMRGGWYELDHVALWFQKGMRLSFGDSKQQECMQTKK